MKDVYKKVDGVYIGSLCNADCEFCLDKETNYAPKLVAVSDIKKRIDHLSSEGVVDCIIYEWWDFSLHPHIFEILAYGNTKWMQQTIQTNWIKFADIDFVKKIKELDIGVINFSLHAASAELYDDIMKTKKWFPKVLKWLKNCKDLGIHTNINFVIMKQNIEEIHKMLLLCLKLWVTQLSFYLYIPRKSFSLEQNMKFMVHPVEAGDKIKQLLQKLQLLEKKLGKKILDIKFLNIPLCLVDEKRKINIDAFRRLRNKKTFSPWKYYYKKECEACLERAKCPWITKYYVDVFDDDFLVPYTL